LGSGGKERKREKKQQGKILTIKVLVSSVRLPARSVAEVFPLILITEKVWDYSNTSRELINVRV